MMRYIPVRIDDRRTTQEFDPNLSIGILFWMNLVGLAVITAML